MSGWIFLSNNKEKIDNQYNKFKAVFGRQDLQVSLSSRLYDYPNFTYLLAWSWAKDNNFPQLSMIENKDLGLLMILHGTITGFGKYEDEVKNFANATKKLLYLWQEHSKKLIPELNGIFSLVINNYFDDIVYLITDRFASQPIWYSQEGETLYAGNFASAVASIRKTAPKINGAGLWALIATSRHYDSLGIYDEIKNISGGFIFVFKKAKLVEKEKWFNIRYKPDFSLTPNDWGKLIAQKLKNSADRIIAKEPNAYLFLSGGMDSRVAAAAFGDRIKSITLTTKPNMNSRISEKVAKTLGIEHQTVIRHKNWYLDSFEISALIASGNYKITHAHFIPQIKKITNEQSDVAFLLGDFLENFNKHYYKIQLSEPNLYSPEKLPAIINKVYAFSHRDFDEAKKLFNPDIREKIYSQWSEYLTELANEIKGVSDNTGDYLDTLFRWYNVNMCPTYLMHECIIPSAKMENLIFDNELFDVLFQIPTEMKSKGILHNKILSSFDYRLLFILNSNFWLPPITPDYIKKMTKKVRPFLGKARRQFLAKSKSKPQLKTEGSWHLLHELYRKDEEYNSFIKKVLFDKDSFPPDIFDHKRIELIWNEFNNGNIKLCFDVDLLLSFGLLNRQILSEGIVV